jgi:hypothetical protein
MTDLPPTDRLALSARARRGLTCSNTTSGSASAQRAIVHTSKEASAAPINPASPAAAQNSGGRSAR